MSFEKALVVDADKNTRLLLSEVLEKKGIDVVAVDNGQMAIEVLKTSCFDLLLADINDPKVSGIEVLKASKLLHPEIVAILMTSTASIENAIEAIRLGAFNYLIKPFSADVINTMMEKAEEYLQLVQQQQFLRHEMSQQGIFPKHHFITESPLMKDILKMVEKAAKSNATVFITGESGTGKEVVARALHHSSQRVHEPFITINCAAIPQTLLESEFFGHEKGAFTGAFNRRAGRFEMAHKGTLLLDEISEIPIELQAKLLRALQEQEFERVGGNKTLHVDVRFIATSNRNLKQCVEDKTFREDLYYRLNVVPIHLPPLRDRREDIGPLAEYFLEKLCKENRKIKPKLSDEAKKILLDYPWPGNVRELANIIERTVVMSASETIVAEDLNLDLKTKSCPVPSAEAEAPFSTLSDMERLFIFKALAISKGNKTHAAKMLGISVRTLRNKLHSFGQLNLL